MDGKNDAFIKRLLSAFSLEADEHVRNITTGLIELEKGPGPKAKAEIIETVFREAHSLKGASRAVNRTDIETVCQSLEGVFSGLKSRQIEPTPETFDTLHKAVDMLRETINSSPAGEVADQDAILRMAQKLAKITGRELQEKRTVQGLQQGTQKVSPISEKDAAHPGPQLPVVNTDKTVPSQKQPASDTVRISIGKLDSLLRQSEELLSLKLMADRHMEDVHGLTQLSGIWDKQWLKIYPVIREFQRLQEKSDREGRKRRQYDAGISRLLEFSELTRDNMKALESRFAELKKTADHSCYATELMVDNLLADIKRIMMLPFSTLFEGFPKLMRDLSRDQGKEVELSISGEEIEIDRRILEEIRVVFLHLLRNTIDHGIEKPEERLRNNKAPRGIIKIIVSRIDGNKVDILVSDDGAGINPQTLKKVCIKRGIISLEEADKMTDQEMLCLVFRSGVSTSPIITDISGRGLGLAIVREKIENLGGQISVETSPKSGTTFKMILPLTLTAFRGVLIMEAEHQFVIPIANVSRVVGISQEEIKTVENRDTLSLDGFTLPLVKLADILELSENDCKSPIGTVLVLESGGEKVGVCVDEIISEQEILIKNLGYPLSRVRNVFAATILGSGKVVPVLNVSDLVKSAAIAPARSAKPSLAETKPETTKKSVLVVEDSITSRMLLKNILETSGYLVTTAVDGIDAMTRLKTEQFDIVVSDVDMPRMNGFNLTEKIRGDKKLAELPVILVTALDSREDKERGIDVGANAYIVKSSFDQSNLLETIRRLI